VLPVWALDFDSGLRSLILSHEDEHRKSRDPLLLLAALAAVTVIPWNIALHWQLRRLRLAVEIDCDTRVLRAHPDANRYSRLLVAIAQLQSSMRASALVPMLGTTSDLERRILAMQHTRRGERFRTLALTAPAAVAILVVACDMRDPLTPSSSRDNEIAISESGGGDRSGRARRGGGGGKAPLREGIPYAPKSPSPNPDDVFFHFEVERMAQLLPGNPRPVYPRELSARRIAGQVLVAFVVDVDGRADMNTFRTVESTNRGFTESVRNVLSEYKFRPATIAGRPVRMRVTLPFRFERGDG
jgi:TonB family protein